MWEEFLPWLIGRLNGLHMQRITLNLSLRFHVAAHKRAAFFIQRITLFSSGWVCTQSGRCVGFAPCKVDKAVPTCGHTGAASSRLAAGPGGSISTPHLTWWVSDEPCLLGVLSSYPSFFYLIWSLGWFLPLTLQSELQEVMFSALLLWGLCYLKAIKVMLRQVQGRAKP